MPLSTQAVAVTAAVGAAALAAYVLSRRTSGSLSFNALRAKLAAYHRVNSDDADGNAWLTVLAEAAETPLDSAAFAQAMDATDPLRALRSEFHIPPHGSGQQAYMAGNSLGLMPKSTSEYVNEELKKWANTGVCGHFEGELPWASCEDAMPPLYAELVGAKNPALEIGAMNSLTVNLHLLMSAFYKPSKGRAAILIEADAFPSDRYAVGSQIRHHGHPIENNLIEIQPRKETDGLLHTQDILAAIDANESRLALVLLGGVNYLSGQVLDMAAISAHMVKLNARRSSRGEPVIPFGLDLAHAVGNVPLKLHEWKVDFAAWCSYKYLNSGAGCLSAIFVHECHAHDDGLYPRLAGWWGVPLKSRFVMAHAFEAAAGAPAFGVSNVNMLMAACVYASLRTFEKAGGLTPLRRKSLLLSTYLEVLLEARGLLPPRVGAAGAAFTTPPTGRKYRATLRLLTPREAHRRGCQLSLKVLPAVASTGPALTMRDLEHALMALGVVGDSREPDVIRLAPVPLYNNFADCRKVADALEACLLE